MLLNRAKVDNECILTTTEVATAVENRNTDDALAVKAVGCVHKMVFIAKSLNNRNVGFRWESLEHSFAFFRGIPRLS